MIDQIIKLVQDVAGGDIKQSQAIPAQFKAEAVNLTGTEIFNGLQSQAKQGNIQGLTSLVKSGSVSSLAGNPIVTQIIGSVAGKFAAKFGISQQTAQQVAATIVPKVISQFVAKTNDPEDKSFDLQDVMKTFGGGNMSDMLGNLTGSKGGLGDAIGGFFK